jgi:hypothetical protein
VTVPKAAVYQDHFLARWENQIRPPRQVAAMKPVAVTKAVNQLANDHFRLRVFIADFGHSLTSL